MRVYQFRHIGMLRYSGRATWSGRFLEQDKKVIGDPQRRQGSFFHYHLRDLVSCNGQE